MASRVGFWAVILLVCAALWGSQGGDAQVAKPVSVSDVPPVCGTAEDSAPFWDALQCGNHIGGGVVFSGPYVPRQGA